MFRAAYPIFEKGRLLKIEMLESLRDYPREINDIFWRGYKNGVLKGCDISTRDNYLVVQPGILYFDKLLYVLKEEYKVAYQNNNRLTLLKVNCMGRSQERDFSRGVSRIYLDFEEKVREDELELCRFQLREGAELRDQYTGFLDCSTEYDTVNSIYVPYLGELGATLRPEIMLRFSREILGCNEVDIIDTMFAMMVLQNGGLTEAETIAGYLNRKGEQVGYPTENRVYYDALLHVLGRTGGGYSRSNTRDFMERGIMFE